MKTRTRNIILICGGAIIVGAFAGFLATGMYPYTRFRDESLAKTNAETGLSDLLVGVGAGDAPPPAAVDNINALGFLPSGPGAASLSVVTLVGTTLLVMAGAWVWERRGRRPGASAPSADRPLHAHT